MAKSLQGHRNKRIEDSSSLRGLPEGFTDPMIVEASRSNLKTNNMQMTLILSKEQKDKRSVATEA